MDFKTWLQSVIKSGNLCDVYKDKAMDAKSKVALMKLCLDANGASYLCEMQAKGYPLSYETIKREFGAYINGRYIGEYKNDKGNGYTSSIYCNVDDVEVEIKTTLTTFLGCTIKIAVQDNDFNKVYLDKNCNVEVYCPKSSRLIIEYWDGANIKIMGNTNNIELIKH